ncbi:hypothetical protein Tco_1448197 [Tanacetum coccineum]
MFMVDSRLIIIEQLAKDGEKNVFWSINEEVRESLLNLKNATYHSRQILRIPRLRRIQDHCLTLKNMSENPELQKESYVLYDHVMTPLAAQVERKPRRDRGTRRGRHSTSSSFAFDQPSSSHLNDDDDDGNDKGTSRASTPYPIRYVNSLTH